MPSWRSRAVRHSGVRTRRHIERRSRPERTVGFFLNSEEGASSRRNGAPKNKGRRLHLESIE